MAKYKEIWANPLEPTVLGYLDTDIGEAIGYLNSSNPLYAAYEQWVSEGNTADPAYTQTEIDDYQAQVDREQEIEDEQSGTGISSLTVAEAKQAVSDRIDITRALPDSNLAEIQAKIDSLCDQTEWLLHKVVVFLLR